MNNEQLDLARQLATRPQWQWRRGMRALFEPAPYCDGSLRIEEDGWTPAWCDDIAQPNGWPDAKREAWPDLTDAATGGVLLDMLGPGWRVARFDEWTIIKGRATGAIRRTGTTLAEACARALLAEWGES